MKKVLILILAISLTMGSISSIAYAGNEDFMEVPTGEDWENIPECSEWPTQGEVSPLWDYTFAAYLYLTFSGDHAIIDLDVEGYNSVTRITATLVIEEYQNGSYQEIKREYASSSKTYLSYITEPPATFGHAYRITALVRVYSGSDYEYITLRNTRVYDSSYLD